MWTNENRGRYDRSRLRYPSDLTDDEWSLVEPLIPPGKVVSRFFRTFFQATAASVWVSSA